MKMIGIDDNDAREILFKLGKAIGFDHVATMARQIAHENSKPEKPAKKPTKVRPKRPDA